VTISRQRLDVGGITVEVVRKEIRHLHIGVYPPGGRVRVAAPARIDEEAVRLAVVSRLGWIQRKRRAFEEQVRQSQREMVTGESYYFQGRRYLLQVIEDNGFPSVRLAGPTSIELRVRRSSDRQARELVLHRWYRQELRSQIPSLLAKWEPAFGESVAEVRIKKMKTLWGSCNASSRRIWLNLELAKKPPSCLAFILVHEMLHFVVRHHNERFREKMDAVLPTWRTYRDELNRAPLAHDDWAY
jgi:predicted metal-dependent hydrolase